MNKQIDITFFEPNEPLNQKHGTLIIEEFGKNMIEFKGNFSDAFRVIDIIFAEAVDSDEKFTLINSVFHYSSNSNYRVIINELYQGAHLSKVTEEDCIRATARVTGLTGWINQPRIKPSISSDINNTENILIKPPYERVFSIDDNLSLRLEEYCYELMSRDSVILENRSQYFLEAKIAVSRLRMLEVTFSFQKLLSLFTEYIPRFVGLDLQLTDNVNVACLAFKLLEKPKNNEALLTLELMSDHFDNMLRLYYERLKDYIKIIDLLNASIENKTSEISFLNLTTALEVFHKHFMEDGENQMRNNIANELEQAGLKNQRGHNWNQLMRYYHLFKYMNNVEFFSKIVPNYSRFAGLVKDSRNYYTHYSKTTKKIWTPNQLLYANKTLRPLVKGVILKKLGMPDQLINQLLNNRFAAISHGYDKNEYSMYYIGGD